jgi:hypothetical protein
MDVGAALGWWVVIRYMIIVSLTHYLVTLCRAIMARAGWRCAEELARTKKKRSTLMF